MQAGQRPCWPDLIALIFFARELAFKGRANNIASPHLLTINIKCRDAYYIHWANNANPIKVTYLILRKNAKQINLAKINKINKLSELIFLMKITFLREITKNSNLRKTSDLNKRSIGGIRTNNCLLTTRLLSWRTTDPTVCPFQCSLCLSNLWLRGNTYEAPPNQ